jgi:thioredoxin-related protein
MATTRLNRTSRVFVRALPGSFLSGVFTQRRAVSHLVLAMLLIAAVARAPLAKSEEPANEPEKKATRDPIYDEKADAKAQIAAAVKRAKHDNKRVLVTFGGNWCGWCYKLHDALQKNEELASILRGEYEQVLVDVGTNKELLESYGKDNTKHGVPFLTVLDGDGKVLTNQNTGNLEKGPEHDVEKVKDFLTAWTPPPKDAEDVYKAGLAQAKSEDKLIFLHLGAPACGWCRVLDRFLADQDAILGREFVDLKIDTARMTNGSAVAARLRKGDSGGIPWFAILDAQGAEIVNSDGPQGNIGYPAKQHEIDHYISMLQKAARRLTPDDLAKLKAALETYADAKKLR